MISKIKKLFMLTGVMLTIASCVTDPKEYPAESGQDGGGGKVRFTLSVPKVATAKPSTRSMTAEQEKAVSDVDVLIFYTSGADDGKFYLREIGVPAKDTGGEVIPNTYEVTLPEGTFDLMVIGNARAKVAAASLLRKSTTWLDVTAQLTESLPAGTKWTATSIPMFGYKENVTVNSTLVLTGDEAIDMHRMVAKIDVELDDVAASGTAGVKNNSNFELTEIYLCNYSTVGLIVPALANLHVGTDAINPGSEQAHTPTIPQGPGGAGPTPGIGTSASPAPALKYNSADGLEPSKITNTIYTFEAPTSGATDDYTINPCLVIGGKFKGGATTYYRVDFTMKVDDDVEYLHLLRNHRYAVRINKVMGDGFDTPEEAYTARSYNIEANTLEWEEKGVGNIVFDGEHTLAVSHDVKNLTGEAHTVAPEDDNKIMIYTDVEEGWTTEVFGEDGKTPMPSGWLTVSPDALVSTAKNTVSLITTQNFGFERKAYVKITAGRLTYVVEVVQKRGLTKPDAGALAPPGVLGVGATTGQLTLRGSKEYSANSAIKKYANDNFGGLADETVYVTVFKWSSLIGLSTVPSDTWSGAEDVVWAPEEFDVSTVQTGTSGYQNSIPFEITSFSPDTPDAGLGDPCHFADKGNSIALWNTPLGSPWNNIAYNSSNLTVNTVTLTNGTIEGWLPTASAPAGSDAGWFFPRTGMRHETTGSMENPAASGYYWTATKTTTLARSLRLDPAGSVVNTNGSGFGYGFAVRCVQENITPPVKTEADAPYILHIDDDGTLDVGQWGADVDQSNILFTQFGSLVGFSLKGNDDIAWSTDAIMFNPTNTHDAIYEADYTSIPHMSVDAVDQSYVTSRHNDTNIAAGKGDICKLVGLTAPQAKALIASDRLDDYDSGFRLPVEVEYANMSTPDQYPEGSVAGTNGHWLASNPTAATFLPYAGYRTPVGEAPELIVNRYGNYWTSSSTLSSPYAQVAFLWIHTGVGGVEITYAGDMQLGFAVRCVPNDYVAPVVVPEPPVKTEADAPYILHIDDNRKLDIGRWGSGVDINNILHTKFGSLVASTLKNNSDDWSADDIRFNPTSNSNAAYAADYSMVPFMQVTATEEGYATNKHTDYNLTRGMGDICKLVGLTDFQAKTLIYANKLDEYDSGFRLPTQTELAALYRNNTAFIEASVGGMNGRWLAGTPDASTFLPYAGYRGLSGGMSYVGTVAHWWSSTAQYYDGVDDSAGALATNGDANAADPWSYFDLNFGLPVRCVPNDFVPPATPKNPVSGVQAPPGVLGVGATSGQLTLRGSSSYSSNADIRNYATTSFGVTPGRSDGLANEIVYIAYFRRGSLIGINGNTNDTWSGAEDVVWVPEEFDLSTIMTGNDGFKNTVPYSGTVVASVDTPVDGTGDPCHFADKGTNTYNWNMPEGGLYWGGIQYNNSNTTQMTIAGNLGRKDNGTVDGGNEGWFFPYAGYRHGINGDLFSLNSNGNYDSNNAKVLVVESGAAYTVANVSGSAFAVRCISEEVFVPKPPVKTEADAPYILHIDNNGKLDIGRWGSGVDQNNILFTNFGSLIGFTMTGDSDTWDETDIKFNPTEIPSSTWSNFDIMPQGNVEANIPESGFVTNRHFNDTELAAGRGDICKLVGLTSAQAKNLIVENRLDEYDSGYRLPTQNELTLMYSIANTTATTISGKPGRVLNSQANVSSFLPLFGMRSTGGAPMVTDHQGAWWSSSTMMANESETFTLGGFIYMSDGAVETPATLRSGFVVRCVPNSYTAAIPAPPTLTTANAPYILYKNGSSFDHPLEAGRWGTHVDRYNMMYTRFGSILAFETRPNSGAWDPYIGNLFFDPISQGEYSHQDAYADFSAIPYMSNITWKSSVYVYDLHNDANLRQGLGDICKLVGLTPAQARSLIELNRLDEYSSGLRLPTDYNYDAWAPGTTIEGTIAGVRGHMLATDQSSATFLPYTGCRFSDGTVYNEGFDGSSSSASGFYWTGSTVWDVTYHSRYLLFKPGGAGLTHDNLGFGYAVRCVPQ